MSKKKEKFNVTQGMTLLLLQKLSLPANLVFLIILFITNPANNIGYEDEQAYKNLFEIQSFSVSPKELFIPSTY